MLKNGFSQLGFDHKGIAYPDHIRKTRKGVIVNFANLHSDVSIIQGSLEYKNQNTGNVFYLSGDSYMESDREWIWTADIQGKGIAWYHQFHENSRLQCGFSYRNNPCDMSQREKNIASELFWLAYQAGKLPDFYPDYNKNISFVPAEEVTKGGQLYWVEYRNSDGQTARLPYTADKYGCFTLPQIDLFWEARTVLAGLIKEHSYDIKYNEKVCRYLVDPKINM